MPAGVPGAEYLVPSAVGADGTGYLPVPSASPAPVPVAAAASTADTAPAAAVVKG